MNCKRLFFGVAVTMGTLIGAGTAAADPTGNPNSETITLTCDSGLGEIDIVTRTTRRGFWTPPLVLANNQVLVPYSMDFEGAFVPHDGGPAEVAAGGFVKNAPRNGRLATCTAHLEGSDEFGSWVLDITVGVSFTPPRTT